MTVLIDPDHLLPTALGTGVNDIDLVLEPGMRIAHETAAGGEAATEAAIRDALGL